MKRGQPAAGIAWGRAVGVSFRAHPRDPGGRRHPSAEVGLVLRQRAPVACTHPRSDKTCTNVEATPEHVLASAK